MIMVNLYEELQGFKYAIFDTKRGADVFALYEGDLEKLKFRDVLSDFEDFDYKIVRYNPLKFEELYRQELDGETHPVYLLYINHGLYENHKKIYFDSEGA